MSVQNIKIDPIILLIKGSGGAGGSSIAEILARSAARQGFNIQCSRAFPAEIRGGTAWFQMKLSCEPQSWWGGTPHLEMNGTKNNDWEVSWNIDGEETSFIADFSPLKTAKQLGDGRNANLVALGFLAASMSLDLDVVLSIARRRYARREGAINVLYDAVNAGWNAAQDLGWIRWRSDGVKSLSNGHRLVLNGNEAIALGAIAAGVRFFAGYPITPASSILELMMGELSKLSGTALQMEDEIAALASCLGASYAGKMAMCATSGPGFALMSELLNLSVMAEIPIVIVDVQRSGPATGQPSRSEQSDLSYAVYGSPGDIQRIVLAPANVEEALYSAAEAVRLAERFQMPVIILSDAALSNRIEAIPEPDWGSLSAPSRIKPHLDEVNPFARYQDTESGISPMPIPGFDDLPYIATGMEHDHFAKPSGESKMHFDMTDKRLRKLRTAEEYFSQEPELNGYRPDVKIGIIGWGSTRGAISEAVSQLNKRGIRIAAVHIRVISPLPEKKISAWMEPLQYIVVAEENRTGQFYKMIRHLAPSKITDLRPQSDFHLTPEFLIEKLTEMHFSLVEADNSIMAEAR